jgi:hypothetical protein
MHPCNRHGGATRERHVVVEGGWCRWGCGRTLGAPAPYVAPPHTTILWLVAMWAWATPTSVLDAELEHGWAALLFCLNVPPRLHILVCFHVLLCKILKHQNLWRM